LLKKNHISICLATICRACFPRRIPGHPPRHTFTRALSGTVFHNTWVTTWCPFRLPFTAFLVTELPQVEKESTMHGHFVLSVLLSLACVASTCAAGPDDDPPPIPPSIILDGPALINDQALTDSGPAMPVQPAAAGPRHFAYRGFETRYRSDDGNCCAEYFGGFGPLWETYCADKNRCRGPAAACGRSPCYPSCGFGCRAGCATMLDRSRRQIPRARIHGPGCRATPACDCDSAAPATEPVESTTQEVGEPAAPTPAQPDESVQPAPTPPPDPPAAKEPVSTSSRRGWMQRRAGSLPR
jgi:hypothetical protein